jgi:hypothetical protein
LARRKNPEQFLSSKQQKACLEVWFAADQLLPIGGTSVISRAPRWKVT